MSIQRKRLRIGANNKPSNLMPRIPLTNSMSMPTAPAVIPFSNIAAGNSRTSRTKSHWDTKNRDRGSALPWDTVRAAVSAVWERMAGVIRPRDPGRGVREWI